MERVDCLVLTEQELQARLNARRVPWWKTLRRVAAIATAGLRLLLFLTSVIDAAARFQPLLGTHCP